MALNYQIALTNVVFDNTYTNVLRFDNRADQETYFGVGALFDNAPAVNFNVGSLLNTTITYDCKPNESVNEMLNKNYCIVKDNSPSKTLNYYYYFVTSATQECGNRIQLSLELDVIQTYYLNLQFGDCLIKKAHLNRFIDAGDNSGEVVFDATPQSQLFEREDIQNVPKRLIKRDRLPLEHNYESNNNLGRWMNNNILCWVYIYVDPKHAFNYYKGDGTQVTSNPYLFSTFGHTPFRLGKGPQLPNSIGLLAFPLYMSTLGGSITLTGGGNSWRYGGIDALRYFTKHNNDYSFIYAIKLSIFPPHAQLTNNVTYSGLPGRPYVEMAYSSEYGYMVENAGDLDFYWQVTDNNDGDHICVLQVFLFNDTTLYLPPYTVDRQLRFTKNEIIESNKNPKFNPKLNGQDYFELKVTDEAEDGFIYDLQKLGNNLLEFMYTESPTPDYTKKYLRINPPENNVYISETTQNLTGFVGNNDNTLIMPTSAYASMIANNKNFFIQNGINRQFKLMSGIEKAFSGNLTGLIDDTISIGKNVIDQNLQVDNLKNAPSSIQAAQGNAIFGNLYTQMGLYVEQYDILDNEKQMINDYMCMFGFTCNRIGNVKNFDNIRKYYNYIQANVQELRADNVLLSNQVRQKIRQIYLNGVRFWNNDTFVYEKENYERWLENG